MENEKLPTTVIEELRVLLAQAYYAEDEHGCAAIYNPQWRERVLGVFGNEATLQRYG